MSRGNINKKELIVDVVKETLLFLVVTAAAFLWWMFVLLLISLFLVNVWHVTFEALLKYGIGFTVVTAVAYAGKLLYQRLHG